MSESPISTAIRWSLVIGHLTFVTCLTACAPADEAWERIRETGVLRVGMDASFPPFEFISADGTAAGFDVDLARELGRRLEPALTATDGPALSADRRFAAEGIEVQFIVNLPYDGLYDALEVGQVDIVVSALVVNPARMADFAYVPYFDAGQVLVVGSEEAEIEEMSDLGGRTLAVEFGTRGDQEARKWARRLLGLNVITYQTADEALVAVRSGEADAALVDHVSALAEYGLVIVGEPVVAEPYAVAARKDSQHLLRAVEKALAEMEADGTLDVLAARWLEGDGG